MNNQNNNNNQFNNKNEEIKINNDFRYNQINGSSKQNQIDHNKSFLPIASNFSKQFIEPNDLCSKNNATFNNELSEPRKLQDNITIVGFAPFLAFNDHDNKYFESIGKVNDMAISSNIVRNCDTDDADYVSLMKEAFYSKENMDYIQKSIIVGVYKGTEKNIILRPQRFEIIVQLMNSIWNIYCRFLPYNYKEQIAELDQKTIEFAVESLIKEVDFYFNYLRDTDPTKAELPPRAEYVSSKRSTMPSVYKI